MTCRDWLRRLSGADIKVGSCAKCNREIRGRQRYVKGDDCLFHSCCPQHPS